MSAVPRVHIIHIGNSLKYEESPDLAVSGGHSIAFTKRNYEHKKSKPYCIQTGRIIKYLSHFLTSFHLSVKIKFHFTYIVSNNVVCETQTHHAQYNIKKTMETEPFFNIYSP